TLCLLLVFCGLRPDVMGFATSGYTWASNQVLYYVNPQNASGMSQAAAITDIQNAATGWTAQTHANIQLVYAGTTSGSALQLNNKNEVFFRNDANGYAGETYFYYDSSGHIIDADIVFHEGSYHFYTGTTSCSGTGVYLSDLAIHEFGHALGLAHSSVAGATMEPSMPSYCDLTQLSLEADDIAGIEYLYPPTGRSSPNTAPTVSITSPTNGASYANGATVAFSGSATDAQDGNLTASLTWTSSLDGTIGAGGSFSRVLSAGTHTITAAVTDKAGAIGSQQVTVTVAAASQQLSGQSSTTPTLTARGYKKRGLEKVDTQWSGFGSATAVWLFRNKVQIATVPGNSGSFTDSINSRA